MTTSKKLSSAPWTRAVWATLICISFTGRLAVQRLGKTAGKPFVTFRRSHQACLKVSASVHLAYIIWKRSWIWVWLCLLFIKYARCMPYIRVLSELIISNFNTDWPPSFHGPVWNCSLFQKPRNGYGGRKLIDKGMHDLPHAGTVLTVGVGTTRSGASLRSSHSKIARREI